MSNSPTPWSVCEDNTSAIYDANNDCILIDSDPELLEYICERVNALAGIVTDEYAAEQFVKEVIRLVGYTEVENGNPKPEYFEVKRRLRAALARKEAAK